MSDDSKTKKTVRKAAGAAGGALFGSMVGGALGGMILGRLGYTIGRAAGAVAGGVVGLEAGKTPEPDRPSVAGDHSQARAGFNPFRGEAPAEDGGEVDVVDVVDAHIVPRAPKR